MNEATETVVSVPTWGAFFTGLVFLAITVCALVLFIIRNVKRADSQGWAISRWIFTVIVLGGMVSTAFPMMASGNAINQGFAVILALCFGAMLAAIWVRPIAAWIARPFSALYDGGELQIKPEPVYSAAIAHRIKGLHREAIYLIREQLEKFPNDFQGQMLIAEIQAQDMKDLALAEVTVTRVCEQLEHGPSLKSYALNSLADWHLSINKDVESATRALSKIQELFPGGEQAMQAAQRLAHMSTPEDLLQQVERRTIQLKPVERTTSTSPATSPPTEKTPLQEIEELVAQLERHPLDVDSRERLATLYAMEFQRLDLATEQLEQLINCPHLAPKKIADLLHRLAEFQMKLGAGNPAAVETLQRILDHFPHSAYCTVAQEKITALSGEPHLKPVNQPIRIGSYDRDLGLKMNLPKPRIRPLA